MKKLLPVLLALLGLGGGVMAGHFLKPAPEPEPGTEEAHATEAGTKDPHAAPEHPAAEVEDPLKKEAAHDPDVVYDYVKLENQFVIPVMGASRVSSLVVLSISLEMEAGKGGEVHAREPKLRDAFLRVLFEHERAGGFAGVFTDARVMGELRGSLLAAARLILGSAVNDVLVTDILRQDV